MQPDRWLGVGSAEGVDAGTRAAGDALRHDGAKLLVVFCSQAQDLPALLRQIRARAGDVPVIGCTTAGEGTLVWIMEGDARSVLEATDAAAGDSLAALGGRPPLGMLAFDRVARRGVLGDNGIRAEIERLTRIAPGTPVAGFYTYGEIARTRGVRGFHNQTLVVLAIA